MIFEICIHIASIALLEIINFVILHMYRINLSTQKDLAYSRTRVALTDCNLQLLLEEP